MKAFYTDVYCGVGQIQTTTQYKPSDQGLVISDVSTWGGGMAIDDIMIQEGGGVHSIAVLYTYQPMLATIGSKIQTGTI